MVTIKTKFAERVGIGTPILGFSHSVDVTAAITKAGGMGVYGIAHDPPETVPARVEAIRRLAGSRPVGIDIMMPKGMPEFETLESVRAGLPGEHVAFVEGLARKYQVPKATRNTFYNTVLRTPDYFEGQLQALLRSDVDLVAFGVGLTPDAVGRLKAAGKVVGALIGSPRHFDSCRDVGLDFLVAPYKNYARQQRQAAAPDPFRLDGRMVRAGCAGAAQDAISACPGWRSYDRYRGARSRSVTAFPGWPGRNVEQGTKIRCADHRNPERTSDGRA
jgi:hypothetical protein